ncbi:hypothetical protein Tco_0822083 [Tanacetum coccineum]|uniref:Uncharacterized protein n=1 Tax=Tanacetum coccineum TaxID=301880 RepID=A0ABQ5AII6_9ASTR
MLLVYRSYSNLSELKAQSQAKDTVIVKLKEHIKSLKGNVEDSSVKMDMDEKETLNIELEHRNLKKQDNSDYVCIHRDDCMPSDTCCVLIASDQSMAILEQQQSGTAFQEMTPVSISFSDSHLMLNYMNQEVIAPIPEEVAPEHAVSTGSPSSTTVDQDAPSPSNSPTSQGTQTPIISQSFE